MMYTDMGKSMNMWIIYVWARRLFHVKVYGVGSRFGNLIGCEGCAVMGEKASANLLTRWP